MIEKREFVVSRQSRQPKRKTCQVDGPWILVDAVEAALRYKTARVQFLVFVRGDHRPPLWPPCPRSDQSFADRTACLHQKGTRSHCRIAYLKIEHLFRC